MKCGKCVVYVPWVKVDSKILSRIRPFTCHEPQQILIFHPNFGYKCLVLVNHIYNCTIVEMVGSSYVDGIWLKLFVLFVGVQFYLFTSH